MSKHINFLFGLVLGALIIFPIAIGNTLPVHSEGTSTALEIRIANLESQMQDNNLFRLRYEAWSWGGYSAILYSIPGKRVRFDGDTSFLKQHEQLDYICGSCRIGDYKHVTLYDKDGNILDRAEFFSKMKVGDLLLAWYTDVYNGGPSTSSHFYGRPWVKPFYWNEKTGLAVAIFRIDQSIAQ